MLHGCQVRRTARQLNETENVILELLPKTNSPEFRREHDGDCNNCKRVHRGTHMRREMDWETTTRVRTS